MNASVRARPLFDPPLVKQAAIDALRKLDPRHQIRNPVMFVVLVGAVLTLLLWVQALAGHGEAPAGFILAISLWLWFTVLFANFAEAMAECRGKAQAASLRAARRDILAKVLIEPDRLIKEGRKPHSLLGEGDIVLTPSAELHTGQVVLVEAGDFIPADGEVIAGCASVDESVVTGESAPVIRESGGDRSAVTGGTRVLSDWLLVKVTTRPGESFLDRMISLVEGARRQRTPNEI